MWLPHLTLRLSLTRGRIRNSRLRNSRFSWKSRSLTLSLTLSLNSLGWIVNLRSSSWSLRIKRRLATECRLSTGVNEINFLLVNGIKPIRPREDIIFDFLALNQLINHPVQILIRVDHIRWEHHFIVLMVVWDKLIKSLIAPTDSHHAELAFHLAVNSVRPDQVEVVFDESNRDPDIVNLNYLRDLFV